MLFKKKRLWRTGRNLRPPAGAGAKGFKVTICDLETFHQPSGNMKTKKPIQNLILTIRGQRVILDADLAELYDVPTKRFNEAFKRNRERFPDDFAFQLTAKEFAELKAKAAAANSSQVAMSSSQAVENKMSVSNWSQIATSSSQVAENEETVPNWSQFVTSSSSRRGAAYRPWAFTEHGALMAANILRSERAVEMSVFVIRAFVSVREQLAANATILKRLAEIDKTLLEHDSALQTIWGKLQPLLAPPPEPPKRRIGFNRENET